MKTIDLSEISQELARLLDEARHEDLILRLADGLNRGNGNAVQGVACRLLDDEVVLHVLSQGGIDLQQWAAERTGEAFRQVYSRPVSVTQARN